MSEGEKKFESLEEEVLFLRNRVRELEEEVKYYRSIVNSLPPRVRFFVENFGKEWILVRRDGRFLIGKLYMVEFKPEAYYIGNVDKIYIPQLDRWEYVAKITRVEASNVFQQDIIQDRKPAKEVDEEETYIEE